MMPLGNWTVTDLSGDYGPLDGKVPLR